MPVIGSGNFNQFAAIMQQSAQFALAVRKLQMAEEQFNKQFEAQERAFKLQREQWTAEKALLGTRLQQAEHAAEVQKQTGPFFRELVTGAGGLAKALTGGGDVDAAMDAIGRVMADPAYAQALPQGPAFLGSLLDALQVPATVRGRLGARPTERIRQTELTADKAAVVQDIVANYGTLNTVDGQFSSPDEIAETQKSAIARFRTENEHLQVAAQLMTSTGLVEHAREMELIGQRFEDGKVDDALRGLVNIRSMLQKRKEDSDEPKVMEILNQTIQRLTTAHDQIRLLNARFSTYSQVMGQFQRSVRDELARQFVAAERGGEFDPLDSARQRTELWARDLKRPLTRALNSDTIMQGFRDFLSARMDTEKEQQSALGFLLEQINRGLPGLETNEQRYLFDLFRRAHPYSERAQSIKE